MKLTKRQAKALSIKKWEYIVGNNGDDEDLLDKHPELFELTSFCGYCEIYYYDDCVKCPLLLEEAIGCTDYSHPYSEWYDVPTKANAQRVLDLIRES